jgi:hypothetical protein
MRPAPGRVRNNVSFPEGCGHGTAPRRAGSVAFDPNRSLGSIAYQPLVADRAMEAWYYPSIA